MRACDKGVGGCGGVLELSMATTLCIRLMALIGVFLAAFLIFTHTDSLTLFWHPACCHLHCYGGQRVADRGASLSLDEVNVRATVPYSTTLELQKQFWCLTRSFLVFVVSREKCSFSDFVLAIGMFLRVVLSIVSFFYPVVKNGWSCTSTQWLYNSTMGLQHYQPLTSTPLHYESIFHDTCAFCTRF